MKIKIENTKQLFNDWKQLSYNILALNAIIQNEGEIDSKDIVNWNDLVTTNINDLEILRIAIIKHIKKSNL